MEPVIYPEIVKALEDKRATKMIITEKSIFTFWRSTRNLPKAWKTGFDDQQHGI